MCPCFLWLSLLLRSPEPHFAHHAVKVVSCYRRLWLTYFTGSMVTQLASPVRTLNNYEQDMVWVKLYLEVKL